MVWHSHGMAFSRYGIVYGIQAPLYLEKGKNMYVWQCMAFVWQSVWHLYACVAFVQLLETTECSGLLRKIKV